ncbi:MAG: hypothetical protein JSV54_04965 [Chloroflexota bacterium]|nr:MAG: hypothetical protein JSV54_04965 [Chloroflexota bacterium]
MSFVREFGKICVIQMCLNCYCSLPAAGFGLILHSAYKIPYVPFLLILCYYLIGGGDKRNLLVCRKAFYIVKIINKDEQNGIYKK